MLVSQLYSFREDGTVVGLPAVCTALCPGLEGLLTQITPGREYQEAFDARARERNDVLAFEPPLLSGLLGCSAQRLRQASKIGVTLQDHVPRLLVLQNVLPELRHEAGKPRIDLLDPRLCSGGKPRTRTHERKMVALQHAQLLVRQLKARAARIEIIDAFEQFLIEMDLRLVRSKARRHLARNGLHLGRRIGRFKVEEHTRHAR